MSLAVIYTRATIGVQAPSGYVGSAHQQWPALTNVSWPARNHGKRST